MHVFAAAAAAILLGIHGDPTRFQNQTGQESQVRHTFVSFAQTNSLLQIAANAGPVPMLALNAGAYGARVTATPRGLATGQNDAFLIRLNAVIAGFTGSRFYVRPFPEMNAYWESPSAYNRNGSRRG